ncbi:MAG: glycosyltransferase family 39 protein [Cyanobacteria bacterium J06638_20]
MRFSNVPVTAKILGIVLVLLGIFFRFYQLDSKVFWNDEVYSAVPVSGYTVEGITTEWQPGASDTKLTRDEVLERYQTLAPGTTVSDTLQSVAVEEPQNSPLYFVLSRQWINLTNLSPRRGMRSLAVLISVVGLPFAYLLCRELFPSPAIAWLGMGFVAISPLHIIYAQEARQYSLLITLTLVACFAFLHAFRLSSPLRWAVYSLSAVLGLYAHPFFCFVLLAHGVYLFGLEGSLRQPLKLTRSLLAFLVAIAMSLLAFLPWVVIIFTRVERISPWRGNTDLSLPQLVGRWMVNLVRVFLDLPFGTLRLYDLQLNLADPVFYGVLLLVALAVYAIWDMVQTSERKIWLFVLTLMICPAIFLILADIFLGGIRSTIPRYILPSYLGVQLAIAYLLARPRRIGVVSAPWPRLWRFVAALVLTASCLSSVVLLQSKTWWSKYSNLYDPAIAALINTTDAPLILSDSALRLISLSYLLQPTAELQVADEENLPDLPRTVAAANAIYVYDARSSGTRLKEAIEQRYGWSFERIYREPFGFIDGQIQLWKYPATPDTELAE